MVVADDERVVDVVEPVPSVVDVLDVEPESVVLVLLLELVLLEELPTWRGMSGASARLAARTGEDRTTPRSTAQE